MRKMRRGPTAEAAEQSVEPGPTPWNPSPPETSAGTATFGSSQIGTLAGHTICPEAQTSNISPACSSTGNGSSCAREVPIDARVTQRTTATPATTDLARMCHLAWTGYVFRVPHAHGTGQPFRTGRAKPPRFVYSGITKEGRNGRYPEDGAGDPPVDSPALDVACRTAPRPLPAETRAEGVVRVRLPAAPGRHGTRGLSSTHRVPAAGGGFPGVRSRQPGDDSGRRPQTGGNGQGVRSVAMGKPCPPVEARSGGPGPQGPARGTGRRHAPGADPRMGGTRPDAHGPGRTGDPATVHRRVRPLEAVFRGSRGREEDVARDVRPGRRTVPSGPLRHLRRRLPRRNALSALHPAAGDGRLAGRRGTVSRPGGGDPVLLHPPPQRHGVAAAARLGVAVRNRPGAGRGIQRVRAGGVVQPGGRGGRVFEGGDDGGPPRDLRDPGPPVHGILRAMAGDPIDPADPGKGRD